MQLAYRGAHYEAQLPQLEADGVEVIGTYRGAVLTRKHFPCQRASHPPLAMTYRGVKYTQVG